MLKSLYNKYFQKSKSFLYPALGIKKNSEFTPSGTYISIEGYINPEDAKLICTFERIDEEKFLKFEQNMLLENPLFLEKLEIEKYNVYIFDFEIYANDWFNFILGHYSDFSKILKKAIKAYYGRESTEYKYMDTYLHPQEYYQEYSELLDIDVNILKEGKELCNSCDLEKETLKIPQEYLEKLLKTT
jgi:hypothetical protein